MAETESSLDEARSPVNPLRDVVGGEVAESALLSSFVEISPSELDPPALGASFPQHNRHIANNSMDGDLIMRAIAQYRTTGGTPSNRAHRGPRLRCTR